MHNVDVEAPRWIAGYEGLADSLANGYDMCIYEYTNDMSCRHLLHQFAGHPLVREYENRVAIRMDFNSQFSILNSLRRLAFFINLSTTKGWFLTMWKR